MPEVSLTTTDGHTLAAYRVDPEGTPRGAVVVLQEIFGVNNHIRAVASIFAGVGYVAIAPAIFDRQERGIELGYTMEDHGRGLALARALSPAGVVNDIAAAVAAVTPAGSVGVVGYCLGGALAWLSAAKIPGISAAVSYYGAQIPLFADARPQVPIQFHLGRDDTYWPIDQARAICGGVPGAEVHEYAANHGFACDHRPPVYSADAAARALQRTLDFFAGHLERPVAG